MRCLDEAGNDPALVASCNPFAEFAHGRGLLDAGRQDDAVKHMKSAWKGIGKVRHIHAAAVVFTSLWSRGKKEQASKLMLKAATWKKNAARGLNSDEFEIRWSAVAALDTDGEFA